MFDVGVVQISDSTADIPKGYWLIELDETSHISSNSEYHVLARILFAWIANEVSIQLDLPSKSIVLTVIDAEYFGVYPCLAAQSTSDVFPDSLANEIGSAIRSVLANTTLKQFVLSLAVKTP